MTSIKTRATNLLREEGCDPDAKSARDRSDRVWLLSDSNGASQDGVEFFIEFPEEEGAPETLDLECELCVGGATLCQGSWRTNVKIGEKSLAPAGSWETLCVDFDPKYAYFERSIPLEGGRRFSRRVLLSYCETLLVIADELAPNLGEQGGRLPRSIRTALPLGNETEPKTDPEAREIAFFPTPSANAPAVRQTKATRRKKTTNPLGEEAALVAEIASAKTPPSSSGKAIAKFYPIGLPEWRANVSQGDFRIEGQEDEVQTLELSTLGAGATVFAPLIVDFNRRRTGRECAWTPLTVGESLRQAKKEDAFGGKLQLGNEQYVLYASTSERLAVRSILGRHLYSDFMFSKFLASLGVDPIIDVELDD